MASAACNAVPSGAKTDKPAAMRSVLTNSLTSNEPFNKLGAAVVLPAPLGPANAITLGEVAVRKIRPLDAGTPTRAP